MTDNANRLNALQEKLMVIPTVSVAQIDHDSNAIGLSFDYMGITYTTYIDAESERGELLRHDSEEITRIENIGTVGADELIGFFASLPNIETILR